MPRPTHLLSALALLAGLGLLAGCADRSPATASGSRPDLALPPQGGPAGPSVGITQPRPASAAAAPAPAGRAIGETPLASEGRLSDPNVLAAACREQADRILRQRDRSELMREDERDSRLGTFDSTYQLRAPLDQLGRRFERDNLARDCVIRNARGIPAQ
jgi:hypothetical protein